MHLMTSSHPHILRGLIYTILFLLPGPALALVPSVTKLVTIVTPIILLTVYPATLHILPSFIWLVIMVLHILPFLFMM